MSPRLNSQGAFVRIGEDTVLPETTVYLSVEGTVTEINYFSFIQAKRKELRIPLTVDIHVLRRSDSKSDPGHILGLLREFVNLCGSESFEEYLCTLHLPGYDIAFFRQFLFYPDDIPNEEREAFRQELDRQNIDLNYLHDLYQGKKDSDIFGIVLDRDKRNHSRNQMQTVLTSCQNQGWECYITNPCMEFWLLLHLLDVKKEYGDDLQGFVENRRIGRYTFTEKILREKTNIYKEISRQDFERLFMNQVDDAIRQCEQDFAYKSDELMDNLGSNLGDLFRILRSDCN